MPEITAVHIALFAAALLLGVIVGWIFRGSRSVGEKAAISLGWQEQFEAQRHEHERLLEQNKSLMGQNSQYQASNQDSKMRASELSTALKEAFERRDELQRQIKDIRSNLEATVAQRDQLQNDMQNRVVEDDVTSTALKKRDEQIAKQKKELDGWQKRVPPLIERFRARNQEADALQQDLATAMGRIDELDTMLGSEQTRVEPVNREALGDDLDASNDPDKFDDSDDAAAQLADVFNDLAAADEIENDKSDDLKMIKGVGPAISKTLNEMGVFRFEQIANMSEYDIDRVAKRLKGFRSRIYREDWIGQARALLDQTQSGSA